jgi:putative zinc finger/helix-turn-helix YgiT family protein
LDHPEKCPTCGSDRFTFTRAHHHFLEIGESILLKPTNLNGAEIRFLRKNLRLKINEFSQLLGVDRVTVSRWENGHERLPRSTDRHIRLTYAVEAKLNEQMMEAIRRNLRTEETDSKVDYFVPLPLAS